jgi:hypothetical protein
MNVFDRQKNPASNPRDGTAPKSNLCWYTVNLQAFYFIDANTDPVNFSRRSMMQMLQSL